MGLKFFKKVFRERPQGCEKFELKSARDEPVSHASPSRGGPTLGEGQQRPSGGMHGGGGGAGKRAELVLEAAQGRERVKAEEGRKGRSARLHKARAP